VSDGEEVAPEDRVLFSRTVALEGAQDKPLHFVVFSPRRLSRDEAVCEVLLGDPRVAPMRVHGIDEMQAVYLAIGLVELRLDELNRGESGEWAHGNR
jgi:hypothetical protein